VARYSCTHAEILNHHSSPSEIFVNKQFPSLIDDVALITLYEIVQSLCWKLHLLKSKQYYLILFASTLLQLLEQKMYLLMLFQEA